jgi:hypothetical protein
MSHSAGGKWSTLWRDVYVASLQGLCANPAFTDVSFENTAITAAEMADAAVAEFDKSIRGRAR